jgi:two-component system chemotaxis response regulator CheY
MFPKDSRFLIADDSNDMLDLVHSALDEMGFQNVDMVMDGVAALGKIKTAIEKAAPYSLVFIDIKMPRLDGLTLLEALRSHVSTKSTPVIVMTTESSKQVVMRAVMHGISGYMVKPFGADDVKRKVQEIFQLLATKVTSSKG